MRRKWLLIALITLPLILVVTLAAVVRTAGSLTGYDFLRGADRVFTDRVALPGLSASTKIMLVRVYNVHRPFKEFGPIVDAEMKAKGWSSMPIGNPGQMIWMRSSPFTSSIPGKALDSGMAGAMDGKAKILPPAKVMQSVDPVNNIEGWTVVYLMEEYRPNWAQKLIDRFSGPVTKDLSKINLQLTPSSAYRKANAPAPVKRKP